MKFQIEYSPQALKDLEHLTHQVADRITRKMMRIRKMDNPMSLSKSLSGIYNGYFRFRIGEYRVFFYSRRWSYINIACCARRSS